ncbi:AAA family ATPase [Kushneria aurantia]|uniref:AAA family ATPase n=1 Tax=Kushneria aurantia TaxID=504092 RepID=A0ABV6G0C0_9GAMM|nr:bifunctional aminoglycoside phosphotransferase/ATP-binding protein [Kushneria aurantia]
MNQRLPPTTLDELVDRLVVCHARAAHCAPDSDVGTPGSVRDSARQSLDRIRLLLDQSEDIRRLDELSQRSEELGQRLDAQFAERRREGRVCEIGSEMPRTDTVQHDGRTLQLNGIEPGSVPSCRDACLDLAALLVDLEVRDEQMLADHALNRYLECSGDYALVPLLSWYKILCAMMAAEQVLRRLQQPGLQSTDRDAMLSDYRRHVALAERYSEMTIPWLLVSVGVAGSGKSRFTEQVVRRLGALRLRSNLERRRLRATHGTESDARRYDDATNRATYERLGELTGILLSSGYPVCIDATALKRTQRDRLRHEAEKRGLAALLISFEADDETLRDRVRRRSLRREESPQAAIEVLDTQLGAREAFGEDELPWLIHLDTTAENANTTLVALIRERLRLDRRGI